MTIRVAFTNYKTTCDVIRRSRRKWEIAIEKLYFNVAYLRCGRENQYKRIYGPSLETELIKATIRVSLHGSYCSVLAKHHLQR
jgi:hypothetical protein